MRGEGHLGGTSYQCHIYLSTKHICEDVVKEKYRSIGKLDGVAMLVTDPPRGYSTTRQNPHIYNHPLYIVVT